ncbi:IS66 family insertion sequence element accessory protein TnpA [Methylomonas sp. BW4-1]|uniref:IS66 family insertion sequence element accessory protein TnpA n=1 Tax=Methylomonas sp. BW4-1 TaxID=3376685 RepID=UPI0040428BE8
MAVTSKWHQHIKRWQSSGLTQAEYCAQQHINVRTFTARLSEYRKLSAADSAALVPVQLEPTKPPSSVTAPTTATMVLTHAHGHRLELSPPVSAAWVAELLRCLA